MIIFNFEVLIVAHVIYKLNCPHVNVPQLKLFFHNRLSGAITFGESGAARADKQTDQ